MKQFHFHTPSEHTIDGKASDMVVHFVHKSRRGKIAVVAVPIKACMENYTIDQIWKRMPKQAGQTKKISKRASRWIRIKNLLPENKAYYQYTGSLTTPPCTENVNWFVLKNNSVATQAQVKTFFDMFSNNARPLQDKNDRTIKLKR